jgi:hypothetical protein
VGDYWGYYQLGLYGLAYLVAL